MVSGRGALRDADGGLRGPVAAGCRQPRAPQRFAFRGREADPFAAPERLTVADACRAARRHRPARHPGRPDGGREPDRDALIRAANAAGIRTAPDDTWADTFSRILVERIEPGIGNGRATLLTEYPAHLAALARPKPGDPRVAERFELYACGVELANAFGELTDPDEQRLRLEAEMAEKERLYGERYPIDEDFPGRAGAYAPCQRRRPGFRPAGHAGDGGEQHRAGDLDAGGGWP